MSDKPFPIFCSHKKTTALAPSFFVKMVSECAYGHVMVAVLLVASPAGLNTWIW